MDDHDGADAIERAWRDGLKPDPLLTVSEWADRYRVLSQRASSEPGRWRTERTPYLREVLDALSPSSPFQRVVLMKGAQVGGPLALDTPLPTPAGWTTMGAVRVGDHLFDENGQPCRVTGVSEVMTGHPCYRLAFDDREQVVADGGHRWPVWDFTDDIPVRKVLRTDEMLGRLKIGKSKRYRFAVDCCRPVELPDQDLIIHPYVLGAWLGDGSSVMNHLSIHEDDEELVEHLEACGVDVEFRLPHWRKGKCANVVIDPTFRILNEIGACTGVQHRSRFITRLRMLDLLDNKHVPAPYLRAGRTQRLDLVRGLMDTDGTITACGQRCEFSNTDTGLVDALVELVRSLGYKTAIQWVPSKRHVFPGGREHRTQGSWRVSWTAYQEEPMFRLSRKREPMRSIEDGQPGRSQRRRIVDIYPVPSVPVRCIEVDSPSHLYLCGRGWIPTHNTEAGNNWIGYVIHQAPGPMMAVAPTVELAKRNSKQRIDPLIEESEVLRERVRERRSRDSGNTVLSKEFPGGVLILTGANSAVGLRSMPARYLFLDEVDGYPGDVEGEGDPILLAERRSATFQRRKILLVSTPKTKGLSRIEREYEQSDQRRYVVPCPHCGERQTLEFANLRWPEGRPREVEYACAHCGALIGERHKTWMLERGEWRPTAPGDGRTAGFHLSSLYSPVGWFSWADAAQMYEQAKKTPGLMKGFVNTVLGLPFEEEAEAPEWQRLYERRETYRIGVIPDDGLFLTAGVDVQKDRIEVEVVAWGRGKESWSVDYRVIEGDTARAEVWAKLDALLAKDWPHASGHTLPIRVMCVDAGYATQDVYAWARRHPQASWGPAGAAARQPRTAVAVKGRDRDTALLLSVSKADAGGKRRGRRVWSVGTPVAKGELYRWLKLEWPTDEALDEGARHPPGACHFPQYGEEYFRQLTAERLVTRIVKGFPRGSWEKEPGRRNEALDCRVYARAAAAIYGLDRFEERHWRRMEEALARTVERDDHAPASARMSVARPPARRVIQSGYMAR